MTTAEKFRKEIEALPQDAPNMDLLKRMLGSVEGQAQAYFQLQQKYADLTEKLRDKKTELSLQAYKALGLEKLAVRLYAYAEVMTDAEGYKEFAMDELVPFLSAAGYDFGKRRTGVDE